MTDRREAVILLGVGVAAAGAGIAFWPHVNGLLHPDREVLHTAQLTDLSGKLRSIDEWQGLILVLNFWATWCPPCREEIPGLVRARDKLRSSGVEFLGIAIDQEAKVTAFTRTVPVTYPLLLADANGLELLRRLGNPSGGLPFTVVLDRRGGIVHRNLGAITQQKIEDQLMSLLSS